MQYDIDETTLLKCVKSRQVQERALRNNPSTRRSALRRHLVDGVSASLNSRIDP